MGETQTQNVICNEESPTNLSDKRIRNLGQNMQEHDLIVSSAVAV